MPPPGDVFNALHESDRPKQGSRSQRDGENGKHGTQRCWDRSVGDWGGLPPREQSVLTGKLALSLVGIKRATEGDHCPSVPAGIRRT